MARPQQRAGRLPLALPTLTRGGDARVRRPPRVQVDHLVAGAGLARRRVLGPGVDQVGRAAAEDVAQRRQDRQRQPFRCSGGQAVHLGGRQVDVAVAEQRHELGDGEHAVGGHATSQPPLVADARVSPVSSSW